MKKLIQTLFGKKATKCITSLPILLLFSTRDADGKVVDFDVFAQWLSYVIDRIPTTLDCISDIIINHKMSKHYQIIREEILIIRIQSSEYSIKTDELENIIASLLKFGEHTNQNQVSYEVNGTKYNLPI
jgi:hypothetical protein